MDHPLHSQKRGFKCTYEGCGKAYTRRDHLRRHALNHDPQTIFSCNQCSKRFARLDLLHRHLGRHEKGLQFRNSGGIDDKNFNGREHIPRYPPRNIWKSPPSRQLQEVDVNYAVSNNLTGREEFSDYLDWIFGDIASLNIEEQMNVMTGQSPILDGLYPRFSNSPPTQPSGSSWLSARTRIVAILGTMEQSLLSSPFFYPSNLEKFCSDYFENYWPHFPIIHRPTFSPTDSSPCLIAAVAMLGSKFSREPVYFQVASALHDYLSGFVLDAGILQSSVTTDFLQTLLLVLAHGKMFSTRRHHEMAHIFHGAMINLFHRENAFSSPLVSTICLSPSLERQWTNWVEKESIKRSEFFAYLMDAQHAMYFGHTPILSANEIHLQLPCDDLLWNAPTAEEWHQQAQMTCESPKFLRSLRALLKKVPALPVYSAYSQFILLHGLFSVATSLHVNESMLVSMGVTGHLDGWRELIGHGIDTWSSSQLFLGPSLPSEAAQLLSRMTQITIHSHVHYTHVFVGAPSLLGNALSTNDYTKVENHLKLWAGNSHSKAALYHSLLLVHEIRFGGSECRKIENNIALRPWCLYHATLVIWVYGFLVEEQDAEDTTYTLSAEKYISGMIRYLRAGEPTVQANKTTSLIVLVKERLQHFQWEFLQEACIILEKLIRTDSLTPRQIDEA